MMPAPHPFTSLDRTSGLALIPVPALPYLRAFGYGCKLQQDARADYSVGVALAPDRAYLRCLRTHWASHLGAHVHCAPDENPSRHTRRLGLGGSLDEARLDGLSSCLEASAAGWRARPVSRARLVGWQRLVPDLDPTLVSLEDIDARVSIDVLAGPCSLPLLVATLDLSRPPHRLESSAVVLHLPSAVRNLLDRLVHQFYVFHLGAGARSERSGISSRRDGSSLTAAEGARGDDDAPQAAAKTVDDVPSICTSSAATDVLRAFEARLQTHGHVIRSTQFQDDVLDGLGVRAVMVEVEGLTGEPDDDAESRDRIQLPPSLIVMPPGNEDTELSRTYHENSKIRTINRLDDYIFPPHRIDGAMQAVASRAFKDYTYARRRYQLPDVRGARSMTIEECVLHRRSSYPMSGEPIDVTTLSHLLFFSYGVTGTLRNRQGTTTQPLRATPSGGALYPIDLYLVARKVTGVEQGLYYYHPLEHDLRLVTDRFTDEELVRAVNPSDRVEKAAVLFVMSACFPRNQWKYRERGYRVVLLDCGHLGQGLVMMASALGLVGHPLMGFADDVYNDLLRLDGRNEAVLYLLALGARAGTNQRS